MAVLGEYWTTQRVGSELYKLGRITHEVDSSVEGTLPVTGIKIRIVHLEKTVEESFSKVTQDDIIHNITGADRLKGQ